MHSLRRCTGKYHKSLVTASVSCAHAHAMVAVTTDVHSTRAHRRSGPRTLAFPRRLHGTRGFRLTWYCRPNCQ